MNLIFDLDGTLLNTLYDLKNAVNYSLEKFGFQQRTLEEIRKAVGNGLKMLIKRSLPEGTSEGTVEAVLAEMKAYYALHCHDETVPYDGIIDMLRSLKAEGHSLAIVSNKADAMVQTLKRNQNRMRNRCMRSMLCDPRWQSHSFLHEKDF